MVETYIKKEVLGYRVCWFRKSPRILDVFKFVLYIQCKSTNRFFGFRREPFFTRVIDLTLSEKSLFSNCGRNTRYKIKRAKREGVQFAIEDDIEKFLIFYNAFAKTKNQGILAREHIYSYNDNCIITKALYQNTDLVMHAYVVDAEEKRVRLLYSASLFRVEEQSVQRNFIGMANRFLHFYGIIYFKENKFEVYDLGGYTMNTNDEQLLRINQFKDGFGGKLIVESNYLSFLLYLYRLLKQIR